METEMVVETSVIFIQLTRLKAQEGYIRLSNCIHKGMLPKIKRIVNKASTDMSFP
jgi:hypothetical protein